MIFRIAAFAVLLTILAQRTGKAQCPVTLALDGIFHNRAGKIFRKDSLRQALNELTPGIYSSHILQRLRHEAWVPLLVLIPEIELDTNHSASNANFLQKK